MATNRFLFFGCLFTTIVSTFLYLLTHRDTFSSIVPFPLPAFAPNGPFIQDIHNKSKRIFDILSTGPKQQNISHLDPVKNHIVRFDHIHAVTSLQHRFNHLTRNSCKNTCRSSHVHCNAKTREAWVKIINKKALGSVPLFSETEYFFQWELQYLKTSPLTDIKTLPNLRLSKVYFMSNNRTKQSNSSSDAEKTILLRKNIPATFGVDLFDGYGHRRTIGGDEVRAWLKGKAEGTSSKVVWATAKVKDLANGSYEIVATPTWTGTAELNVAVSYPREYIRLAVHYFRIGIHRFIFGKFKRGNAEEVTMCHSSPNVPGRQCVCNMTKINSLPFYCGRPLNKRLSCDDWSQMSAANNPGYKNLTEAETRMDKSISRPPEKSLIQQHIPLRIKEGIKDAFLSPCRNASRRTSWTMTSPRGVWSNGKTVWNSLVCREPPMTPKWVHSCLKSTKVWMIGDSNMRHLALHLTEILGCVSEKINQYPSTSFCRNEAYNITVQFRPHEYPLYVSPHWLDLLHNGAVLDTLSSIPSTGEHIVVLHYFLHFSSSHFNVLLQRLRTLKTAISTLLSRNPKVLVVIRGPHTSALEWKRNHIFAGDVLGTFIRRIYIDTFQELQDKVVFLDGWDMSISFGNLNFHPAQIFVRALWRTLLSYKCD